MDSIFEGRIAACVASVRKRMKRRNNIDKKRTNGRDEKKGSSGG